MYRVDAVRPTLIFGTGRRDVQQKLECAKAAIEIGQVKQMLVVHMDTVSDVIFFIFFDFSKENYWW